MRFYTNQHPLYCGIDLHARTMDVCILSQDGEVVLHRNMQAAPEPLLKAIAPSRDGLVVAVECLFTWYWLADLCAHAGIPFVLEQALSLKALHGGKAKNATIDSQKSAVWLRGGMRPQAYVEPAAMRATRDLLRRRLSLSRKRAELLGHVPQTHSQDTLPPIGKTLAYKANRTGVVERFSDPAVYQSVAVDLALLGYDAALLRDLEWPIVQAATQHDPQTLSLLQTVPGIGTILRLVLVYAIHDSARFPRVQDVVSSCRLVQCAKKSASKRYGTSGTNSGNASLQWAFSAAAVLLLRDNPAGQQWLARLEKKHGKGKILTILAHTLARAVYSRLQRGVVCDGDTWLRSSGRGGGEPVASLGHPGWSLGPRAQSCYIPCVDERCGAQRPWTRPLRL